MSTTTELHAFASRIPNQDAYAFHVARYTFTFDGERFTPTKAEYLTDEGWQTSPSPDGGTSEDAFKPTVVLSGIDMRAASSPLGDFVKELLDDDSRVQRKLLAIFRDAVEVALGEHVEVFE